MRFKGRISALTLRILAINLTAIAMLATGILYVVQYQDQLVEAELETIRSEAQIFAAALAEGATHTQLSFNNNLDGFQTFSEQVIMPHMTKRMVSRFGDAKDVLVRVYDQNGNLIADSSKTTASSPVEVEELSSEKLTLRSLDVLLKIIPQRLKPKVSPDVNTSSIQGYPAAVIAWQGNVNARIWEHPKERKLYISAAAPIQKVKHIVGVLYLSKPATVIEGQIRDVQIEVLKIFMIVLFITIIFSLYLSRNMAGPLKKLAFSAHAIRKSKTRDITIPDFSKRQDEIGELSIALRDMTNSLWQRMDAIEGFAADVAHELKNPLTSLRSAVETARKVKDDKSRKKLMDIILHDVQRLDRLITDISKSSRLDSELSKEEMVALDLVPLFKRMEELQNMVNDEKDKRDVEFSFNISDSSELFILGNDNRLMQVFENIIANAITFSPAGGVVSVSLKSEKEYASITVEDEGKGIPDNKLTAIFDRFYTERPKEEGYGHHSGLGLSIAKQIVDAHKGKIFAENVIVNEEIKGARFTVKIPLLKS